MLGYLAAIFLGPLIPLVMYLIGRLLDSVTVALAVAIPVALIIWLTVLKYLIRGIGAANRGERYEVPAWICAQIAK
jgi:hypothetical protein